MKRTLKRVLALCFVLALCATLCSAAFAASVDEDRSGVLLAEIVVNDMDRGYDNLGIKQGTCFLINENTIVTANHVVHLDPEETLEVMTALGYATASDLENHLSIEIYYQADLYITAVEISGSESIDYSVLQLSQPIQNHTILELREDKVSALESVYALGFPAASTDVEDFTAYKYTSADVNPYPGQVMAVDAQLNNITYLRHSATCSEGVSGGPLVDENGYVVGVVIGTVDGDYNYAIDMPQIITNLKTLGITYSAAGAGSAVEEPEEAPVEEVVVEEPVITVDTTALQTAINSAKNLDEEDYKDFSEVSAALSAAQVAMSATDQTTVDNAASALNAAVGNLEEASSINWLLIIIIAVVVVVVIVVVVIIIVVVSHKKPVEEPVPPMMNNNPYQPPMQPQGGFYAPPQMPAMDNTVVQPQGGADVGTSVLDNAGATTVLGADEGTTVLSKPPYARLTRESNGEVISVRGDNFIIGKDRGHVTYHLNNQAVSRTHAKIVNVDGKVTVVDLGSTNGTFVNGVRVRTNESQEIKDGDKITLADESFIFNFLENNTAGM